MLGFIMTRYVISEETANYWLTCYSSIRRFYPDSIIMIIDDGSDHQYLRQDVLLENCFIIRSEFGRCGEFLSYYYFHKYRPFDRAVIIHDSVFFQTFLDFESFREDSKFIWHFTQHMWDDVNVETGLIARLSDHEDLISFYHEKHLWNGCFGVQSYIRLSFLDMLQDRHNIMDLVRHVKDRYTRSCMERVIGCIFTYYNREMNSLLGSIYQYMPWGYNWKTYQKERDDSTIRHLPIVKIWSSR